MQPGKQMTKIEQHTTHSAEHLRELLATVNDPEIPVLSVLDLGIIRDIQATILEDGTVKPIITITPTYSGCPAMDVISMNIRLVLLEAGYKESTIKQQLSPAWTTDWMSEEGKNKLKAYGIAPPHYKQAVCTPDAFQESEAIQCPQCNSWNTTLVAPFGSTACKALYKCEDCKEPFDYFKCH